MTGEFLAQKASNAENVSIWWRHHVKKIAQSLPSVVVNVSPYFDSYLNVWWHNQLRNVCACVLGQFITF